MTRRDVISEVVEIRGLSRRKKRIPLRKSGRFLAICEGGRVVFFHEKDILLFAGSDTGGDSV